MDVGLLTKSRKFLLVLCTFILVIACVFVVRSQHKPDEGKLKSLLNLILVYVFMILLGLCFRRNNCLYAKIFFCAFLRLEYKKENVDLVFRNSIV